MHFGKFFFTTGDFVFRAFPSSNLSQQLRLATTVAVFSSDVYRQLAINIASGKLQVLSSLGEYFIAFHCVHSVVLLRKQLPQAN